MAQTALTGKVPPLVNEDQAKTLLADLMSPKPPILKEPVEQLLGLLSVVYEEPEVKGRS